MSIEVTCIECGASHRVNQNMAGRRVRCPQCDTVVHVSEADLNAVDETDEDEVVVQEVVAVEPEPTLHLPATEEAPITEPHVPKIVVLDDEDDDDEVLVRAKRDHEEIDMTPMVDVTFLLLIFFMVTAAFSLQKSIEMPRQQTDAPSTNVEKEIDELAVVEVQIDEFGSFLVMAPDWERETPGKQNLITALREAIATGKDAMRLDLKVHELAKLHALVDALDAGTIAGYTELQVTQVEEFD
jgi:biopolymer transport protein ExbD